MANLPDYQGGHTMPTQRKPNAGKTAKKSSSQRHDPRRSTVKAPGSDKARDSEQWSEFAKEKEAEREE
jgi:hypothetical protein